MVWALVAVSLLGSLGLNAILYFKLRDKIVEVAQVRSDPFGSRVFQKANRELRSDQDKIRVLFFGDSRIAYWHPLPTVKNVEMVNRGIGGQTTSQLVGRIQQDVLDLQPNLVVVQAGINDLKEIGVLPQFQDAITQRCISNLENLVATLSDAGIPVVMMTVFANGPIEIQRRPFWSDKIKDSIAKVNQAIASWADDSTHVFESSDVLEDASRRVIREYSADALHLTPLGYKALNETMTPLIEQLVNVHAE